MIVTCLGGACTLQHYRPEPIDPVQKAIQYQDRSLNSPQLHAYMTSQGYPREAFPVAFWGLHELSLAAFHYHPDLAVARAEWQAARAQQLTAQHKPNPSFSSTFERHSDTSGGISPWALGIGLGIPLETGDKRNIRMEQARQLSEAARLDIGQQAWQVRSKLQAALIDYRAANRQLQLLNREVELQSAIAQMLQTRQEAGLISDNDLSVARIQLQKLQNAQIADNARLAELRAAVASAVGLPAQALNAVKLDESAPDTHFHPRLLPAETQKIALLNRVDVRSALARYAAAESRLQLEIAKQIPDLVLSPGYMFDQNDNIWSLGLSLLLGSSNKNEGPIAEAEANRTLEARRFEALQAHVINQQGLALTQYESRLEERDKAVEMLSAQKRRIAYGERQFRAGFIDRLEWTTLQLEALAAEQGVLAASIRLEKALAALEDALQHPINAPAPSVLPASNSEDFPS